MDPALLGGVAVLERAVAYALGSLALVTPDALDRPTPCRHWVLYDLLEHLYDSMAALEEAIEIGRVDPVPVRAGFRSGDRVVPVVRDRAVRLLGAWASLDQLISVRVDDEPVTAPLVAGAGALEVTIHGWDVAQACGRLRPIPDDLADELLDLALLFVQERDRPGRFGPPIGVPASATPGDRLLAFLGREPA
jgi:uncharacterized protein (TIGR03086 family)